MVDFQLHILGCGSASPTTRHMATSQIVKWRDKLYMVDCGEGTQVQMRRQQLRFSRLNHIFISHLHGDHCFGLPGMVSTFGMLERRADLFIHAPDGLEAYLQPILDRFCKGLSFQVRFNRIDPFRHALIMEDRSMRVYSIPLKHRLPTCGFLFEEKNEEAPQSPPPRRYAYCSDTVFCPDIIPLIQGVDLLYHEATFCEAHKVRAKQTAHSTALQAAEIALRAGAKKLVIGHFSSRYKTEEVFKQEADSLFAGTILACEGQVIPVEAL